MNRNFRLKLCWLSLGFAAAVGCGAKDEGVGSDIDVDDDPSLSDDEDDDDSDSDQSSGGGRRDGGVMDAGNPDEHEVITIEQPDATCAATSAEAPKVVVPKEVVVETMTTETKPVAIYLMLDRSSSMVGYCPSRTCSASSWSEATQAITAFASDPGSSGISVGLGYFPPLVPVAMADKAAVLCSGMSCGAPAVPVRRANDNAALMANSLAGAVPPNPMSDPLWPLTAIQPNLTPTECAIRGMDTFCKAHTMTTGEKCVGVLVTDGVPEGDCSVDANNLATITAAASAAGTQIFTLGLTGAEFGFLDRIAVSGKTDCTPTGTGTTVPLNACDVRGGQAAFIAALNAIRETVVVKMSHTETHTETKEVPLDCEWNLPDPPADQKFDKEKVNVTFSATGKPATTLGRVDSEADCAKHPEGWRYDNPDEPKKVLACPQACDDIKKASGAKISIEFGCKGRSLE